MSRKTSNPMAERGFFYGLVSSVLWPIVIIPILAIVFSRRGLRTFDPEKHTSQWMARWGMILGVLCTSVFAITVLTGLLTRFSPNADQSPSLSAAEGPVDVDSEKEAITTMAFVQRH